MKCLYPIADNPVYQFVMPVIRSNMYVLIANNRALVIDPHIDSQAEKLLHENGVQGCVILLTHEHFDHISGVNWLREQFNCQVICTAVCSRLIDNSKRSGAATFGALFLLGHTAQEREEIEPWLVPDDVCQADETFGRETIFVWQGIRLVLKEMGGHSPGSQIILAESHSIFTGDNLIPGRQAITRLPGGCRMIYERDVRPYLQSLPKDLIVFPGHGEPDRITGQKMQQGIWR